MRSSKEMLGLLFLAEDLTANPRVVCETRELEYKEEDGREAEEAVRG
jgi:hypothetical protein